MELRVAHSGRSEAEPALESAGGETSRRQSQNSAGPGQLQVAREAERESGVQIDSAD